MEERKKSYSTRNFYNKDLCSQKVRFEDEREHKRIFNERQEKYSNEATEKVQKSFQKQSHKLKAYIPSESKSMVCKFLRQDEEKSSRIPSHKFAKETRCKSDKNDASHQSRNSKVADKFPPVNEADINNRFSETTADKINGKMSFSNQSINNLHNRPKNQFVNISKELCMGSNACDKLSSTNGDSSTWLSEAKHKNNSYNTYEEISPVRQNNCAYSETTNISAMSNGVVDEFSQPCGGYDGQNFKFEYQIENEHSNNLSANDVFTEQKVNSVYENSAICRSVNDFTFCKPLCQSVTFSDFELQDLLHYNVNLMQGKKLFDYAFAVRDKIMQRIGEFKNSVRDELKILCAISDGTLTEKNQILITERTCHVIKSLLKQSVQTDNRDAFSKESEFCVPLMSNHPESNPPRVQDITKALNPQVDNYIHENCGSQALEVVQMYDFPFKSNGENIENVTLDKNVLPYDDRFVNEKNAQVWDADNHAYENSKARSTMSDLTKNLIVVEKHEHSYIAVNSEETEHLVEERTYSKLSLSNLLQYDIDTMKGNLLLEYAYAVKEKVLGSLNKIKDCVIKDKLEFMCEITDGSQTEENQKLITERMCHFISEHITVPKNKQILQRRPRYSPNGRNG